ncbi:hypothetical protein L208DRAFT_1377821 [Tricholoma matsutake]|nr:hypothetical protein L208DRAFT_1377821 [Tricholoma matsutake 945]
MERLLEQLEGACWGVHLNYMKSLLVNIIGGDTDCSVLCGESMGVCLQLGEPSFIILLEPDGSPVSTVQASSNLSQYFGRIVKAHKKIPGEQSPQEAAQKFVQLICTFISCILHGKDQEKGGLLGKTLTYLGKVEGREDTGLAFKLLLWVEEASQPSSTGCGGAAVCKHGTGSFCAWDPDAQLLGDNKRVPPCTSWGEDCREDDGNDLYHQIQGGYTMREDQSGSSGHVARCKVD